jgi:glycine oxidase
MKVTIIGAGIIGTAIAEELGSRGAEVRVFDPRPPGDGSTQASAGMLAPYVRESQGKGHAGPPLLDLCLASLGLYDKFVASVESRSGMPVEYQRNGSLQVAFDAAGRRNLEEDCRRLSALAVENRFMEGSAVQEFEPRLSPTIIAAQFLQGHGYVNVKALMVALAKSAERAGVKFLRHAVDAVESGKTGATVITSVGGFAADAVVVAGGSWSGNITDGGSSIPVRPIRGQLLHLRFDNPPISRIVGGSGCYLVPWQDGSLLVGATVENVGFDERSTVAGVYALLDSAQQMLPELGDAVFEEVRVGLRPVTLDELPVIGRSSTKPWMFHATGHYRNGVLLAPLTAALVADLVLDGREDEALSTTRPDRFGN